ncbi:hypothetical protein, partial [Enterococcus faecium]|uniref:hypothetical protein n=1 Tax=Enterococcus faecium TaxID=1352 RepID=UPI001E3E0E2C
NYRHPSCNKICSSFYYFIYRNKSLDFICSLKATSLKVTPIHENKGCDKSLVAALFSNKQYSPANTSVTSGNIHKT